MMLRIFKSQQNNLARIFVNSNRFFNYQKDIYNSNFSKQDDLLQKELNQLNKFKIEQPNLYRFIKAYHQHGHKTADINPLSLNKQNNDLTELSPISYGLSDDVLYSTEGLLFSSKSFMGLDEIESYLKNIYSNKMSIEFDFLSSEEEKLWINREFEKMQNEDLNSNVKIELAKLLLKSQAFDAFLATKFPTFKRYSNEGAESSMAFYYSIFSNSALNDIEQLVMGIAHRGRLNLMMCMLNLDPIVFFAKLKGKSEYSEDVEIASGDISHHFPCSTDLEFNNKKIHVNLMPNPSHLEAVDPLVLGKTRSKQMLLKDGLYANEPSLNSRKVSSFLVHGDAAFAGQGIVSEIFQGSRLPNYAVGGTVHLITNNQVGFTAPSNLGRSGRYNSDLAKGFDCPIIHINGDCPELAYKAAEFSVRYRNKFSKDIICDLICFRKHGHNELDDPSFTNPLIYKEVNNHQSVPNLYKDQVVPSLIRNDILENEVINFRAKLDESLDKINSSNYKIQPRNTYLSKLWSNMNLPSNKSISDWYTGCNIDFLKYVGTRSVFYPPEFSIHPTIERAHVKKRIEKMKNGKDLDWSTCESLAVGSLLLQGFNVRISGQDVGRGTFSHRHALLVDQVNNKTFIPLNNLDKNQTSFLEMCNSYLSEEAVLGFDYGFSLDNPNNLVIWEAQFGDFFNGAQIIIDNYISSSEAKWLHQSGIVLLLPHGFDGAGPEHSSCRIERFLQMSSSKEDGIDSESVNMFIANPTTPANYFHLLRRQMVLPFRKPLIVAAPKLLIRLPECVSTFDDLDSNTTFKTVLDDHTIKSKDSIKRLIFVFGKHYYALETEKIKKNIKDTAIIRIEEMSPFPAAELKTVLSQYKNVKEYVWSQEEHRNMGAWSFVSPRFENILGIKLKYTGREVASCISGISSLHVKQVKEILSKPFDKF